MRIAEEYSGLKKLLSIPRRNGGQLPSIYQRLEYITCSGSQYIETPLVPVNGDEFHCKFTKSVTNQDLKCLFSAGTGSYQTLLIGKYYSGHNGFYIRYFSSPASDINGMNGVGAWNTADIDEHGTLTLNNNSVACVYQAPLDGDNTTLWLFRRRNGANELWAGNISEFWVKNNGTYKMNMIPCIRKSDQKVGMYDTVGRTFYISNGSQDFVSP